VVPDEPQYLRGGQAARIDTGRIAGVLVGLVLLVMVVVTATLTVSTADRDTRISRLRQHGVAVDATVVRCLGVSSGIGMGIEYWQCQTAFALSGERYVELLGGSRTLRPVGSHLSAVVVPGDPGSLTLPAALSGRSTGIGTYSGPMAVGAATLLLAGGVLVRYRRISRPGAPTTAC
jgi:hypothetical protein